MSKRISLALPLYDNPDGQPHRPDAVSYQYVRLFLHGVIIQIVQHIAELLYIVGGDFVELGDFPQIF